MLSEGLRAALRGRLQGMAGRLEAQEEALRAGLERPLKESVGELSSYDQHPSDLGSESFERAKDRGLLERLRTVREEVRQALARLEEGRYGYCQECGAFIGEARLQAIPYARRCAACQRSHDASERRRLESHRAGRRPLEEAALMPPFGRSDDRDPGEAGLTPDDVRQALARHGGADTPQDLPGAVGYGDVSEGPDATPAGSVEETDRIPDVSVGAAPPGNRRHGPAGRGRPSRRKGRPADGPRSPK